MDLNCSASRHSQQVSASLLLPPLSPPPPPPPLWPAEKEEQSPLGEMAWDVDQGLIAQLKEQYRKERKGKKGVKSKSRCRPVLHPPSSTSLHFVPLTLFL